MSSLFKPKIPKTQDPVRLPDEDDPAIAEEARRRRMSTASRQGRASTILTGGMGSYSGATLGS